MHLSLKLDKNKLLPACSILTFFFLSCGVAKKEDKSKTDRIQFRNVSFNSTISLSEYKGNNIPMKVVMDCPSLNYNNYEFEIGDKRPYNIHIPYNANCSIKIKSFTINSKEYVYKGKSFQITTNATKDTINYIEKNEQFFYEHATASASLVIKAKNKKIEIYISEFFGPQNATYSTDNEIGKIAIENIHYTSNFNSSEVGYYSFGWRINSENSADFWYLANTNHPAFLEYCKVYINTDSKLTAPYQIHKIDNAFKDEGSIPCKNFGFQHSNSSETTFKADDNKIINKYLGREVFLIFKESSNPNLPKYGLLKLESEDKIISTIAQYQSTKIKDISDKYIIINTPEEFGEAKTKSVLYSLNVSFIKNNISKIKEALSKEKAQINLINMEENLAKLKNAISNYENKNKIN